MSKRRCYLCARKGYESTNFKDIEVATVPSSKKSIKIVLQHLANCIKKKLIFEEQEYICPNCLKELSEYDDLMLRLLTFQKKLTKLLETTLSNTVYSSQIDKVSDSSATKTNTLIEIKTEDNNNTDTLEDSEDECQEFKTNFRNIRECTVCNKLFKSKLQLSEHIIQVHDSAPIHACHICGAVRRDEEYLELHMNIHEGKTENECRYCSKSFSRPVNTLRHMRKHWNKKKFQCEKCGVCFSQDNLLYNHKLRHEAEENPLICSICNQSFRTKKTYNHHMQIHEENRKRHQCDYCSKSFTERYTLKMHMKTHQNVITQNVSSEAKLPEKTSIVDCILPTPCIICGTKFENKDLLNEHLEHKHDVILML